MVHPKKKRKIGDKPSPKSKKGVSVRKASGSPSPIRKAKLTSKATPNKPSLNSKKHVSEMAVKTAPPASKFRSGACNNSIVFNEKGKVTIPDMVPLNALDMMKAIKMNF